MALIYLDNAATTLHKPPEVGEAVLRALGSVGNAARGAHGSALDASRTVYDLRCAVAHLFHCPRPDHVAFTLNSTMALNIAIRGAIPDGAHVITTDLEHNSVLRPLQKLIDERGCAVSYVPADRQGRIDLCAFSSLLEPETKAVVCTHASNLTGEVLDLEKIGAFAHAHGLLFIVDASQTAGSIPINMEAMGIDILCFTGHKSLMGPQGTGGLCVRPGVEVRALLEGGSGVQTYERRQPSAYPTRLEAGTLNVHGLAGLLAALSWIEQTGVDVIGEKERALSRRFYEAVSKIPGVTVYGDFSKRFRAPIVSVNVGSVDSSEIADILAQDYDIAVRAGAHCAPRMHAALGTVEQGAVRFSFSYFNTAADADAAIAALREITVSVS